MAYVLIISPIKCSVSVKRYGLCCWCCNPVQFSHNTEASNLKVEIIHEK